MSIETRLEPECGTCQDWESIVVEDDSANSVQRVPSMDVASLPALRSIVKADDGRIGQVMALDKNADGKLVKVWLRPPDGGCEWTVVPDAITALPGWQIEGWRATTAGGR